MLEKLLRGAMKAAAFKGWELHAIATYPSPDGPSEAVVMVNTGSGHHPWATLRTAVSADGTWGGFYYGRYVATEAEATVDYLGRMVEVMELYRA